MTCKSHKNTTGLALLWAAIIIAAALMASGMGLSDSASFGLVSGLTGAAWGSIATRSAPRSASCAGGCLL